MKKLKEKWGIKSNFQLIIIFIVFAVTGSSSLVVSQPILDYIGFNKGTLNSWIYEPLRLILIFPVYQVLILIFGAIFQDMLYLHRVLFYSQHKILVD